jgi:hypothetical protein
MATSKQDPCVGIKAFSLLTIVPTTLAALLSSNHSSNPLEYAPLIKGHSRLADGAHVRGLPGAPKPMGLSGVESIRSLIMLSNRDRESWPTFNSLGNPSCRVR